MSFFDKNVYVKKSHLPCETHKIEKVCVFWGFWAKGTISWFFSKNPEKTRKCVRQIWKDDFWKNDDISSFFSNWDFLRHRVSSKTRSFWDLLVKEDLTQKTTKTKTTTITFLQHVCRQNKKKLKKHKNSKKNVMCVCDKKNVNFFSCFFKTHTCFKLYAFWDPSSTNPTRKVLRRVFFG